MQMLYYAARYDTGELAGDLDNPSKVNFIWEAALFSSPSALELWMLEFMKKWHPVCIELTIKELNA